jgi:chemotaxis signal transduction protein
VTPLRDGELEPPPAIFRGLAGEYLRGMVRRRDRLTVVLEVARLLSATEHMELHAALDDELSIGAAAGG